MQTKYLSEQSSELVAGRLRKSINITTNYSREHQQQLSENERKKIFAQKMFKLLGAKHSSRIHLLSSSRKKHFIPLSFVFRNGRDLLRAPRASCQIIYKQICANISASKHIKNLNYNLIVSRVINCCRVGNLARK